MIARALLVAASVFAAEARAEATIEGTIEATVEYALEHLVSGNPTTTQVEGTKVSVTPLRTWKSVSGHWCRRYELIVSKPGTAADEKEGTRCRDGNDNPFWKIVEE